MKYTLFPILLSLLFLFQVSCIKKKEEIIQTASINISTPNPSTKPDTGQNNSYYSENYDYFGYFERSTSLNEDYYSVISIYKNDRLFFFTPQSPLAVDSFNVNFGNLTIPYDTIYKTYLVNSFNEFQHPEPFKFPNYWYITYKNGLFPIRFDLPSIPDTFAFVHPAVDSTLAGLPYELKLDRPILGADSVLVQLSGKGTFSKIIPAGVSSILFSGEETARFKSTNWLYCSFSILAYKRHRLFNNGQKYIFESSRKVSRNIFIK
jgi:hypothetical protein